MIFSTNINVEQIVLYPVRNRQVDRGSGACPSSSRRSPSQWWLGEQFPEVKSLPQVAGPTNAAVASKCGL